MRIIFDYLIVLVLLEYSFISRVLLEQIIVINIFIREWILKLRGRSLMQFTQDKPKMHKCKKCKYSISMFLHTWKELTQKYCSLEKLGRIKRTMTIQSSN